MARRHKSGYGDPVEFAVSARQAIEHTGFRWAVVFRFGGSVQIWGLYLTKSAAYEDVRRLNAEPGARGTQWEYELARIDLGE